MDEPEKSSMIQEKRNMSFSTSKRTILTKQHALHDYLRLHMYFQHFILTNVRQSIIGDLLNLTENTEGLSKPFKAEEVISMEQERKLEPIFRYGNISDRTDYKR